jgi:predicted AAA+ superfamily ATPase
MIPRTAGRVIRALLKGFPVITITGPRQSGKTTLTRVVFPEHPYASLANPVSVLEASYLVFLLRPHHANFNKRLVKTPKLYFFDTGLLSWLLGMGTAVSARICTSGGAAAATRWMSSPSREAR